MAIHCARSFRRQRTTPWVAGIGPFSTTPCKRLALLVVELGRRARCLAVNQPVRPSALKCSTQFRITCKPDTAHPACRFPERPWSAWPWRRVESGRCPHWSLRGRRSGGVCCPPLSKHYPVFKLYSVWITAPPGSLASVLNQFTSTIGHDLRTLFD